MVPGEFGSSEAGKKGGKARAESLSKQQRTEIARRAADARWGTKPLQATHVGELTIGDLVIPCAVLEDGSRILSETGVINALGLYRSGAVHVRERDAVGGGAQLPLFVANKNLKPFVDNELAAVLQNPVWYYPEGSGTRHKGFDAKLLPKVCDVWLKARDAGALRGARQPLVAVKADILVRGLAQVGIIALIDEATGFQDHRAKDALARFLEAFIAKELRQWVRTFPADFYKEMFRLRGLEWPSKKNPPQYVGHLTNDLVYERLAPGILEELKKKNPASDAGTRKARHHQWLTAEIGHPKLLHHLGRVTGLMQISDDWDSFKALLDKHVPKYRDMPLFKHLKDD